MEQAGEDPKVVHQIWLGSPFPQKYKRWQKSWRSMAGWEYKLWTEKEIDELQLINQDLYDQAINYGQKSDIARIEILERFGGLYVDTDFECIKPELFSRFNHMYDFYCGIEPLDLQRSWLSISNALIASRPHHPLLKAFIAKVGKRITRTSSVDKIIFETGPAFFTELFSKFSNRGFIDIALPPTFFYPLGAHQAEQLNYSLPFLKQKVIKPETAAIHWWAGSWKS